MKPHGSYRTNRLILLILALANILVPADGRADVNCPSRPLRLILDDHDGVQRFYSTARAEALGSSTESIQLAVSEARLAAKAALLHDERVPKGPYGRLRGVTEVESCFNEGYAYVTLLVDSQRVRQAIQLERMMERTAAPPRNR